MIRLRALVGVVAFVGSSGCALQPYALFSSITLGSSYPRPPSAQDIAKNATIVSSQSSGEACTWNMLGLFAGGDGSIRAAVADALARAATQGGDATMLVDVKLDRRIVSYGGLYSKFCTRASGITVK